ncbi:MAG: hypothetical protein Q9207_007512 [Kuettlingeria erythrocarpa]
MNASPGSFFYEVPAAPGVRSNPRERPWRQPEQDTGSHLPKITFKKPQTRKMYSTASSQIRDLDEGIGSSSDTPVFSSDDLPPSVENYFDHRQKRQRRGPWWQHADDEGFRVTRHKSRRTFKRNFDSGVWMGSDSSNDGFGPLIPETKSDEESLLDLALRTFEEPHAFNGPVFPYWEDQPPDLESFWQLQEEMHKKVEDCMNNGADTIDLSHAGLTRLARSTLAQLQFYVAEFKISPSMGEPLTPSLKLFLANNQFTRIPGQLLRLETLTVLSLRGNNLTELPPAINSLINLDELNVGSNKLRWLPYEIRDLLDRRLRLFGFFPNPFIRPMPKLGYDARMPSPRLPSEDWKFDHPLWSTKPALLNSNGTLTYESRPSPTMSPDYWPPGGVIIANNIDREGAEHAPRVPSLLETCLRNLRYSPQLGQLPFLLPKDAPPSLDSLLKHTWHVTEAGGQRCTICNTPFIVPRTEWLEWWQLTGMSHAPLRAPLQATLEAIGFKKRMMIGLPVPLLRRGCSWRCVPESSINQTGWCPAKDLEGGIFTHTRMFSPRSGTKT